MGKILNNIALFITIIFAVHCFYSYVTLSNTLQVYGINPVGIISINDVLFSNVDDNWVIITSLIMLLFIIIATWYSPIKIAEEGKSLSKSRKGIIVIIIASCFIIAIYLLAFFEYYTLLSIVLLLFIAFLIIYFQKYKEILFFVYAVVAIIAGLHFITSFFAKKDKHYLDKISFVYEGAFIMTSDSCKLIYKGDKYYILNNIPSQECLLFPVDELKHITYSTPLIAKEQTPKDSTVKN